MSCRSVFAYYECGVEPRRGLPGAQCLLGTADGVSVRLCARAVQHRHELLATHGGQNRDPDPPAEAPGRAAIGQTEDGAARLRLFTFSASYSGPAEVGREVEGVGRDEARLLSLTKAGKCGSCCSGGQTQQFVVDNSINSV